jgi:hypothetical protein
MSDRYAVQNHVSAPSPRRAIIVPKPVACPVSAPPRGSFRSTTRNKSLFASFSSEKEESSFFEKKKQKTFIS